MLLYAYWLFQHGYKDHKVIGAGLPWALAVEGIDAVKLSHLYIRTKGAAKAMRVDAEASWATVAKGFVDIEATGREMVELVKQVQQPLPQHQDGVLTLPATAPGAACTPEHVLALVPGNGEHCGAYGGCHFRNVCPEANSIVALGSLFRKHETKGDDIMSSSMDDLKARLNAKMGAAPAATPALPAPPDAVFAAPGEPGQPPVIATGIVPPDAPPRTSSPEEVAAANAPAVPAAAKRKPGRPPKVQAVAAPTHTDLMVPPETVAEVPAPEPEVRLAPRVLYINTRPYRGRDIESTYIPSWEIWMANLLTQLHTELKTLDYRLVEYGKGRGALNAFIKAKLSTAPAVCVINTAHPEAQDFLAIAIPLADHVVGR